MDESFRGFDRRQLLRDFALLSAGAWAGGRLTAQSAKVAPTLSGWVDVHHHFAPPAYTSVLVEKGLMPKPLVGWSVEKTLDDMDKGGVRTAFNSTVVPGVWFGDKDQARHLARDCNEYAAKLMSDHPGRFGSFATLLVPDIDGSLKEMAYALDVLKADGVMLLTSYQDKWLGDPFYAPIFEELDRRKAVVFTHPTVNACCNNLLPGVSAAEIEYGTDTTRAIVRMVFSGAAKRYPNIRMTFSHGGGTMPYLIGRFTNRVSRTRGEGGEQHDFQAEISRFYYDTAQTFHPVPMTALKHVVPMSQILFGTDYPYRSTIESTMGLIDSKAFDPSELEAVKSGNAMRLFPRLTK